MREMRDSGVAWIGEVPVGWEVRRGKTVLRLLQRPVLEDDEIITCFRDGEVTLRANRRTDGYTIAEKEIGYQGIEPGDLVVHGMDGFAGSIGISDSRGKATPVLNVLDSKQNKRFLMYYLRALAYREVYLALADGIRVRSCNLSWKKISTLPIVLPPLPEQRRIAEWLDERCASIDAAVEAARASIDEYEAYKKSVISHAVTRGLDPDVPLKDTGIPWLGQIPEGWEVIKQKYLMTFTNGRAYAQNEFQSEGKYRVLRVGNCNTNSTWYYSDMELAEDKYCDNGDLLYLWSTTFGPYIWIGEKVIYHYHIWKVEPREEILDKRYAYYMLEAESDWQRSQTHGFTMVHITKAGIEGTYAPLPPLPEQHAIAAYLDARTAAIDAVVAQKRAIVEDLLAYKKSLIYEAVTGKREV